MDARRNNFKICRVTPKRSLWVGFSMVLDFGSSTFPPARSQSPRIHPHTDPQDKLLSEVRLCAHVLAWLCCLCHPESGDPS